MTCPRCHDTRIIPFGEADVQACPTCQETDDGGVTLVLVLLAWAVLVAAVVWLWPHLRGVVG